MIEMQSNEQLNQYIDSLFSNATADVYFHTNRMDLIGVPIDLDKLNIIAKPNAIPEHAKLSKQIVDSIDYFEYIVNDKGSYIYSIDGLTYIYELSDGESFVELFKLNYYGL